MSWTRLPPNILCDEKKIWTFPAHLNHRRYLLPTVAILGVAAGLVALDHSDAPYFRRTNSWNSFNSAVSGNNTAIATVLVPVALYGVDLLRHDSYGQGTAMLAGEAAADAEIVAFALKEAVHRVRPSDIPPNGNFSDTWFEKPGASSFPSAHEIAAFSIATVMARRYRNHKWVPYVAYGSAALIGLSRITASAHFPSDVFMGAALGYGIARVAAWQ